MAEVGEAEPGGEKSGWEAFTEAARRFGAEGLEYEKLPDGSEVLRQKLGEGWHGLGYDGRNLWLGLTQAKEKSAITRFAWNGNTKIMRGKRYSGIVPEQRAPYADVRGILTIGHPLTVLYSQLREQEGVEVHITSEHVNWEVSEKTRMELNKRGELKGHIPFGCELKAVITNIPAEWDDAGWVFGREQRLTIHPK